MPDSGSNFKLYQTHADQTYQSILLHGFCCPYKHLVVVVFIDRNVISEQREQEKKKTLLSNCKNTANRYKITISQDNKSPSEIQTNTRE